MDLAYTADDYTGLLLALLPDGPAWPKEPGSETAALCEGIAQEMARADARATRLIEESDPRTTNELLTDWERVCGLPTACMSGISQTIDQRRGSLVARLTDIGGQRPVDYINAAALVGYTITITEFRPFTFQSPFNYPLYGTAWAWAWQVNAPATTRTWFNFQSSFCDPLSAWGNELLECIIKAKAPAHTTVIFSYT